MIDSYDSYMFDQYQLVPREQPLRVPIPDHLADFHSKPIGEQPHSPPSPPQPQFQAKLQEQDRSIQQLRLKIDQLTEQLELKKQQCLQMEILVGQVKTGWDKPGDRNDELLGKINRTAIDIKGNYGDGEAKTIAELRQKLRDLEAVLQQKQSEIKSLKVQLFQSTANNINALFNFELTKDQCVLKQIGAVKQQILQLRNGSFTKESCTHDDRISDLLKSYEQILNNYHKSQHNVHQLKSKQQQYFNYISTLKSELSESIQQKLSLSASLKLTQFQSKLTQLHQMFPPPERVRVDDDSDYRFREFVSQIETLNQQILQREIQVEKLRETNQSLMAQIREYEGLKEQAESIGKLQTKLKERDKRIQQLESSIIDRIESRAKEDSNTSMDSDIEKHKNTVRNLKVVVTSLKQENSTMKSKLKEMSSENQSLKGKLSQLSIEPESLDVAERVSYDEPSLRVVEDVVGMLIDEAEHDSSCKCLQKITEHLLQLNREYPELQPMLEELGVVQKTSSLIPVVAVEGE